MKTALYSALALLLGVMGCATAPKAVSTGGADSTLLPGVSAYYEQATAPHRRAVRKPVRDERTYAMRRLAEESKVLMTEVHTWDSDARLVSIAEPERPAAREAVANLEVSLQDLHDAATRNEPSTVRAHYARVLASYRHVCQVLGPEQ